MIQVHWCMVWRFQSLGRYPIYTGCHGEPQEEDANCIYRMMPNRFPSTELILELKVRSVILQTKSVIRKIKVKKNVSQNPRCFTIIHLGTVFHDL